MPNGKCALHQKVAHDNTRYCDNIQNLRRGRQSRMPPSRARITVHNFKNNLTRDKRIENKWTSKEANKIKTNKNANYLIILVLQFLKSNDNLHDLFWWSTYLNQVKSGEWWGGVIGVPHSSCKATKSTTIVRRYYALFSATVRLRCENNKYITNQQARREYGQLTVNIFIYTVFVSVDRIKDTD